MPLLSAFTETTTDGFTIEWLDFNNGANTWELEYGLAGFPVTGIPNIVDLTSESYTFDGLDPGKTYEVYIRTNCGNSVSLYNGPYFNNTVIDNEASCGLELAITDNNCPATNEFLIQVDGFADRQMGVDVFLQSANLIISHPWPADLRINLTSPQGVTVPLTTNNGRGIDNYGDPSIMDCSSTVTFTDDACLSILDAVPPYIGSFNPEGPLSTMHDGTSPDGQWSISICDRAGGDLGFLNYAKLDFVTQSCNVPSTFRVSDIEGDNITVSWDDENSCEVIELVYRRINDPIQLSSSEFFLCTAEVFTLQELEPGQTYEMIVKADCGNGIFSAESCAQFFTTACQNSNSSESFDSLELCEQSCARDCIMEGIWRNASTNSSDWIVNSGPTPTSFTGPEDDVSGGGNYIYIETQELTCPDLLEITLISDCLTKPNDTSCALIFNYHMFGSDVGDLYVEYSTDGINWERLFSIAGSQGEDWEVATVNIPDQFSRGQIRFFARKLENATRGDIAIDKIKLVGIDTVSPQLFFVDSDLDGFGDVNSPALVCSDSAPLGFSENSIDCNDNNASINPASTEIRCNQIDENCNGDTDDASTDDLDYRVLGVTNESCLGTENGVLVLEALNGQPPYIYDWSNGATGASQSNLTSDIYTITISDVGGCQIVTQPIFVGFEDVLVYSVQALQPPNCAGQSDGQIELRVDGGVEPYDIIWSNDDTGLAIQNLEDGVYTATITDASNCAVLIDSLELQGPQVLTVGLLISRDVDCNGSETGFMQIGVLGGTPPYDIEWSHGITGAIANNLIAGDYQVTVTDSNNCENILSDLVITEPDSLEVIVNTVEDITCPDGDDSFLDIKVEGGTPPYAYFWSSGQNTQDLVGVPSGIYDVTVSDFQSCSTVFRNIEITEPDPIEINADNVINVICSGSTDGFVSVNVAGGNGGYQYSWGILNGESSDAFLENLAPGSYSLTVVDDFNCKSQAFSLSVINQNIPLDISLFQDGIILCHDDTTAQILAQVEDAQLPLDFNWSSGEKNIVDKTIDTISNLIADTYNVTVTDNEGCVGIADSIIISAPAMIGHTISRLNNDCWDDDSGEIQIEVTGGVEPYRIDWSHGEQGLFLTDLETGSYEGTITDGNGCSQSTLPVMITSPDTLRGNANSIDPTENELGSITLLPTGGRPPYSYRWGDPLQFLTDGEATNLEAGSYEVTIIDDLGCAVDTVITLTRTTNTSTATEIDLAIFPNPTNSLLYVQSDSHENIIPIDLINLQGSQVQSYDELYSNDYVQISELSTGISIDLSNVSAGVYFLRLAIGQKQLVHKVIIL